MLDELRHLQARELREVADEAVRRFRQGIERQGINFTGTLADEFESFMAQNSEKIAVDISFNYYGRYKDMKTLGWTDAAPPVDVMEDYVRKVGVGKFAWVPGYENSDRTPALSVQVKRLAWAIAMSFKDKSVRRKQGSWYNETKMRMVNVARRRIMDVTAQYLATYVADGLENGS
jgi:hypothetical protein